MTERKDIANGRQNGLIPGRFDGSQPILRIDFGEFAHETSMVPTSNDRGDSLLEGDMFLNGLIW